MFLRYIVIRQLLLLLLDGLRLGFLSFLNERNDLVHGRQLGRDLPLLVKLNLLDRLAYLDGSRSGIGDCGCSLTLSRLRLVQERGYGGLQDAERRSILVSWQD